MDTLAEHLERLRRRLLSTARGVTGARAFIQEIYDVGPLSSLALCAWLGGAEPRLPDPKPAASSGTPPTSWPASATPAAPTTIAR